MHWRLSIAEWTDQKGDGNRRAMRRLATKTPPPGLIGYLDGEPIAWCSLGPRAVFPRLERSLLLKAVEDEGACAITCVFVHRKHRHDGLLPALLQAACSDAANNGYELVEGYPARQAGRIGYGDDGHCQRFSESWIRRSGAPKERETDHAKAVVAVAMRDSGLLALSSASGLFPVAAGAHAAPASTTSLGNIDEEPSTPSTRPHPIGRQDKERFDRKQGQSGRNGIGVSEFPLQFRHSGIRERDDLGTRTPAGLSQQVAQCLGRWGITHRDGVEGGPHLIANAMDRVHESITRTSVEIASVRGRNEPSGLTPRTDVSDGFE